MTALQRRALRFMPGFAQARKALDRLRKLSSLKFFASKTQAKMTGEPIEISPAKKKELKELFSLIDEDGSGEVLRVCSACAVRYSAAAASHVHALSSRSGQCLRYPSDSVLS